MAKKELDLADILADSLNKQAKENIERTMNIEYGVKDELLSSG